MAAQQFVHWHAVTAKHHLIPCALVLTFAERLASDMAKILEHHALAAGVGHVRAVRHDLRTALRHLGLGKAFYC